VPRTEYRTCLTPSAVLISQSLFEFTQDFEQLIVGKEVLPRLIRLGKADDPVFIDHEPRPLGPQVTSDRRRVLRQFGIVEKGPIGLRHLTSHIAQEGIGEAEFLGPCLIRVVKINTHAQHLGTSGLELGQIKLEGQRFRRSGASEGTDVEEHHDRLLPDKVG
jgi:hypothetical protein